MNADAMQVVPNEQQQRTYEQQIANNSKSGNVIASLQPPVPQAAPSRFLMLLRLHSRQARITG